MGLHKKTFSIGFGLLWVSGLLRPRVSILFFFFFFFKIHGLTHPYVYGKNGLDYVTTAKYYTNLEDDFFKNRIFWFFQTSGQGKSPGPSGWERPAPGRGPTWLPPGWKQPLCGSGSAQATCSLSAGPPSPRGSAVLRLPATQAPRVFYGEKGGGA